jgi:hypothetical protein
MDKKLLSLASLFFLTFGIFAAVVVFNKPLTQLTRAKEDTEPSAANSLLFAWPLKVPADGKQLSEITVFVRSTGTKPISNKTVSLTSSLGSVKESSQTTDSEGKAVFHLTSEAAGVAEVTATLDGALKLNQTVTIKFE